MVPVTAVIGIFAEETGQCLVFRGGDPQLPPPAADSGNKVRKPKAQNPNLKTVK